MVRAVRQVQVWDQPWFHQSLEFYTIYLSIYISISKLSLHFSSLLKHQPPTQQRLSLTASTVHSLSSLRVPSFLSFPSSSLIYTSLLTATVTVGDSGQAVDHNDSLYRQVRPNKQCTSMQITLVIDCGGAFKTKPAVFEGLLVWEPNVESSPDPGGHSIASHPQLPLSRFS